MLEEIRAADRDDWHRLLAVTDLLIDGPYRAALADLSRPWVGSTNQRYHFLTERYRNMQQSLGEIPNRLEIRMSANGSVLINGMANSGVLDTLVASVGLPMPGD